VTQYRAISPHIDLPAMDHAVLSFWNEHDIFQRSIEATATGLPWTFYEGPPTANGMPGTHHVEARVFKDVFPRFQTMKGRHVIRKAGWDCHGLPVELAVEKELGFSGKGDIENYGIAEFNDKCRASVQRHVDAFENMTERMGFWVDFDQAYWTMSSEYVESVWWSLQQIWQKGLLVQDHRVAPYCPRCGTGLSDHELAQGYETIVDPSVYVRFPLTSGPFVDLGASLLVWTTTPWTLVSNTAVAAHPDVEYVVARTSESDVLIVAEALIDVLGEDVEVLHRVKGQELERMTYSRPFDLVEIPDAHYVVLATYVTTEDGTGLVHQSPAFGAEDLAVCRAYGLPVVNPVRGDGTFEEGLDLIGGVFFKTADKALVKDLKEKNLLYKHLPYEHSYPHCWRCHTALLYYAQPSWYIRTTALKDELLQENEKTNWYPETIKNGRYGDWLNNNIDWALSRNRFWGTPLPIWRCENDHMVCVGSLAELGTLAEQDLNSLDPHRPFVDDITFSCAECAATMTRVPEVIDCWYDSGAMPFAQWGYPHAPGSKEAFEAAYPADFICEALDQTRGWFYTLMAIGTLVFDASSYKNVLCLGLILDKDGRKMSKHLGNVLEPMSLMDQHGADAVRWFMLAGGSPWQARRIGHEALQEVVRKTLLTFWNTVSFHSLYARTASFVPGQEGIKPPGQRSLLDQWVLSELNQLVDDVEASLNDFDSLRAGRAIAAFIDDLSNWYVRRSRRRFWDGDADALATLHEALRTLSLLMAPLVPFIAEHVWQELVRPVEPDANLSIHLSTWPQSDPTLIRPELNVAVALTRRLVELGRAARAESGVRTRQPLQRALIAAPGWAELTPELRAQIADELNVLELHDLSSAGGDLVDVSIKANFRSLGRRYGKRTQEVAAALGQRDPVDIVTQLRNSGRYTLGEFEIALDDVVITETPRSGWAVASGDGESVALDLTISDALRRAGLAREVIRLIQDGRKNAGLDVSDRIDVHWKAEGELEKALAEHGALIASEVLATHFAGGDSTEGHRVHDEELGFTATITKL
jgi:isoleucyl-tRNA synthetase